ncbi:MAG: barstar family protein [Acidobacteriota bacterium]
MTAFNEEASNEQALDWTILRDGGIVLYWRSKFLADDLSWLEQNGYQIVSFDAAGWGSEEAMHQSLQDALSFPDYYGRNLDALDECICDNLVVPDAGGLVLVLRGYDHFAKAVQKSASGQTRIAEVLLDIFARAVRYHMLHGKRLLILIQSDDPKIEFGRVGGQAPTWNHREWFNKDRGL